MGGPRRLSLARLFVYGTLRRGAAAASLMRGADPLGSACFRGRLYDLGAYPGAVASPDPADVVHGELFALPARDLEARLARLDRYEGPEYRRDRVHVTRTAGDLLECWIYLYLPDVSTLRRIPSGDWRLA